MYIFFKYLYRSQETRRPRAVGSRPQTNGHVPTAARGAQTATASVSQTEEAVSRVHAVVGAVCGSETAPFPASGAAPPRADLAAVTRGTEIMSVLLIVLVAQW